MTTQTHEFSGSHSIMPEVMCEWRHLTQHKCVTTIKGSQGNGECVPAPTPHPSAQ